MWSIRSLLMKSKAEKLISLNFWQIPRKVIISMTICIAIVFLIIQCIWMSSSDSISPLLYFNSNKAYVLKKEDLAKAEIIKTNLDVLSGNGPITPEIAAQDYLSSNITGYVSNISMKKLNARKEKGKPGNNNNNTPTNTNNVYDSEVSCQDLSYNSHMEYSKNAIVMDDNLLSTRRELIRKHNWLSPEIQDEKHDKHMTEEEIVEKQWFSFGGSAIWLESEQCYLVYSRIVYSRMNRKNHPHLSLVRGQAFDKNWNEIFGKNISYLDVIKPKNIESELRKLNSELNPENCELLNFNSLEYEACKTRQVRNKLKVDLKKEKILSRYVISYPTIIEIPFSPNNDYRGPEDARVILRSVNGIEEPVLLFNMDEPGGEGRRMYSFLPHRKVDPLVRFSLSEHKLKGSEKNWTPFFHPDIGTESLLSRGFIYFIYTFSPLEIFKCSLNDGSCDIVFDGQTLDIDDSDSFGGMRGGTQFISLPKALPALQNKNIWIGFPKLHITDCGCSHRFYRPMLDLLVESDGVYHQELVVPAVDFGIDVLSWDLKGTDCGSDTNILSPNSIAYWDIVDQDPVTKQFEDYLVLSVSEADTVTKIITLRGVLNYVLGIYAHQDIEENFSITDQSRDIIGKTFSCLVHEAKDHCKIYGESHNGLLES